MVRPKMALALTILCTDFITSSTHIASHTQVTMVQVTLGYSLPCTHVNCCSPIHTDQEKVEALMKSIQDIGLQEPVSGNEGALCCVCLPSARCISSLSYYCLEAKTVACGSLRTWTNATRWAEPPCRSTFCWWTACTMASQAAIAMR